MDKQIVLVTGANTGLGYQMVKALSAHQELQVLMGCRTLKKGEQAVSSLGAPANVSPFVIDITNDASIESAYKSLEEQYGRLDVLINNAGSAGKDIAAVGVTESSRKMWEHVFNINVVSTGVFTQAMIPLLEKSKLPKLLFTSSTVGSIGALEKGYYLTPQPYYTSSKTAVNMLVAYWARSLPHFKVNAVCPGYRATGLNDVGLSADTDPALGAVRMVQMVLQGPDGDTGTFSDENGTVPW